MTTLYRKVGRRYIEAPNPMGDVDGQILIMSAVRQALGSSTYVPSATMDWAEAHWDWCQSNARHVMVRDVIQWLENRKTWDRPGMDSTDYRDKWTAFALRLIEREGLDFGHAVVWAALHHESMREAKEIEPFLKFLKPMQWPPLHTPSPA